MTITFPEFTGLRCLMMPYIQGDPESVPEIYRTYSRIVEDVFIEKGAVGFLTIDESVVVAGKPHRGDRAKHSRAIHTEAGTRPFSGVYRWGGGGWGNRDNVRLDADTKILLASNIDDSCAVWDATRHDTSFDGDIGHAASLYPYDAAKLLKAGEVHQIGILTPHESLPIENGGARQFLRIVGAGVHGREPYFTENPAVAHHAR